MSVSNVDISEIINFVDTNTKHFDDSHNVEHAKIVYNSSLEIAKSFPNYSQFEIDIITYASLLHDVCDHKYKKTVGINYLAKFIENKIGKEKCDRVIRIISNVSFSKEIRGQREHFDEPDATYLTIISDADRLEAIGNIGIYRCETFTKAINGIIPDDVVKHCHEKLLRLYEQNFIKTDYARKIAEPLHQIIVDYVKKNSKIK